jgi:site-specific DNA recombinase
MEHESQAVILARVSSKSQEDEGYSLDSQLKLLTNYCEGKNLVIRRVFRIAETASKERSRKIFQELLTYVKKNKIDHLAVEKTDRLTRNFRDAVAIDDWLNGNDKRMLHAVKENLLLHKEARSDVKFMWNIHLAVAKKYTDNLREEAMKGWAEKLAQGWLPAPPPPGYKTVVENGKRTHCPDPKTAPLVKRALKGYLEDGNTIETVYESLERMGVLSKNGRRLSRSYVEKMLKNPYYMGIILFNGQEYPGAHKPLITEDLYNAIQDKLHRKRPPNTVKHDTLLKGMMTCELCSKAICWQRQKGRYYGACRRDNPTCKARKFFREDEVVNQISEQLEQLVCPSAEVMDWIVDMIEQDRNSIVDGVTENKDNLMLRIKRIQAMDEMLYDDKLAGEISKARYVEKHEQLQQDMEELRKKLDSIEDDVADKFDEAISIIKLTQNAAEEFKNADTTSKRAVLSKLYTYMGLDKESVSVKFTKLVQSIADKSLKSRSKTQMLNMTVRTNEKSPSNRGDSSESECNSELYPIWLGRQDSNLRMPVPKTGALPLGDDPSSMRYG